MLKHKGGNAEKRKVLQTDWGWLCLSAFIGWDKAGLWEKVIFFKVVAFFTGCLA